MSRAACTVIPGGYRARLDLRRTEVAIKFVKDFFERNLAENLNLLRVSAPLAVEAATGINDHLNGVEAPAGFVVKEAGIHAEVVQSLAKWKRAALADYKLEPGEGLYTDMNAIRPDDVLDNVHSVFVDQWDWEKVIACEERTLGFLKSTVTKIYGVIRETERAACGKFPELGEPRLPEEIRFFHTEELADKYPHATPREREDFAAREHGAAFIIGIGADLPCGTPHDGRAADYDDWSTECAPGRKGLNGDIVVWNDVLERSYELSSMGIRVDSESLLRQLEIRGEPEKAELEFHSRLLRDELPLSMGGGIGQSRLCALFLKKAHIGEVQVGIWPREIRETCAKNGIALL